MLGHIGYFLLLASSWFTTWRFYVWAKRAETRAGAFEARLKILAANIPGEGSHAE